MARSSTWRDGYRLFGYRNPHGAGSQAREFATFQDEWLRYEWFNRSWDRGDAVVHDVSPSVSYRDFAFGNCGKMLRAFDGVC